MYLMMMNVYNANNGILRRVVGEVCDEDVDLYTYHLPRALVIPMSQGRITVVPLSC